MAGIVDKHSCLSDLKNATLELGCGESKLYPRSIGVDVLDYPCVDVVGDVHDVLDAIPTASVDHVYSNHFFEHVDDVDRLLDQLGRVMKPGATMRVLVPHALNPHFYSDPTHKSFFALYTFAYLADSKLFHRSVPSYQNSPLFDLVEVRLMFRSPGWPTRNKVKRVLELLVNSRRSFQEFFEENLSTMLPPYGVDYRLRRKV